MSNFNNKKKSICLNMIVKNEAHIITETLNSILKYIDYWIISDTGSTDGTQDLIKTFFASKNIPGELVQHEWKDFGHNRTLALEACRDSKKNNRNNCDYIWIIDADDIIVGEIVFPQKMEHDIYYLKFGIGFTYTRPQILKYNNNIIWKYSGILHEFVHAANKEHPSIDIIHGNYYIDSRRLGARNKDPLKYQKDAEILVKAIEENPNDPLTQRYTFYAGQSYRDAKDYHNAIKYYQKRVDYNDKNEEVFIALHQIAKMQELIHKDNKNYQEVEKIVSTAYMKANSHWPSRAEPLFDLAKFYNINNQPDKAYFFLKRALKIPQPPISALFVIHSIYEYAIEMELFFTCSLLDKKDEGMKYYENLTKNPKVPPQVRPIIENAKRLLQNPTAPTLEGYTFIRHFDSPGFDCAHFENKTMEELKKIADNNPHVAGFNTFGFMKSAIRSKQEFIQIENKNFKFDGLYVKNNYKIPEPFDMKLLKPVIEVNKKLICFYIGYTPDLITNMLYGSELATVKLAEAFAKNNHKVYIFGKATTQETERNGVVYLNSNKMELFGKENSVDVLIISRYVNYFLEYSINPKKTFIWLHDICPIGYWESKTKLPEDGKFLINNMLKQIDGIIALCDWHKKFLMDKYNYPDEKILIIGNAIDAITQDPTIKKQKHRFIWTSCLQRNVERAIRCFHKIHAKLPDAELHIYRDPSNVSEETLSKMQGYDYIKFHGKVDNKEIIKAFQQSEVWFYPTNFCETYCISALEAQANSVFCIAMDLAALNTTVGDRGILLNQSMTDDMIVDVVLAALADRKKMNEYVTKAKEWADKQTWENRALEWQALFD